MAEDQDQSTADIARETAIRTAMSFAVQLGLILAVSAAVSHREEIIVRARQLHALIRRRRGAPADTELQVAEFRHDISEIGHAGGS